MKYLRYCQRKLMRIGHRLREVRDECPSRGVRWDAARDIAGAVERLEDAIKIMGEQIHDDVTAALERRQRRR